MMAHMLFIEFKLRQVYLTKLLCTWSRVLSEVSISARGYNPLLFARAFDLHAKTETMTVLLRAFRCRSSLSVCWVVGHPGQFGKRCFCSYHLRNSQAQVNKFDTCNKRMR